MDVDEYAAWQLYFSENPFPGDAVLDSIASVPAFLESAWSRKPVRIGKHRIRYERPKSPEELEQAAKQAAGNLVDWSK